MAETLSDGYHTFAELYRYRMLYNAAAFNAWAREGIHDVHKSWRHSDGEECFGGGWFIVVAQLPTGQISNHYAADDWDLFRVLERAVAAEWDGHTANEAADRLAAALAAADAADGRVTVDPDDPAVLRRIEDALCGGPEESFEVHLTHMDNARAVLAALRENGDK